MILGKRQLSGGMSPEAKEILRLKPFKVWYRLDPNSWSGVFFFVEALNERHALEIFAVERKGHVAISVEEYI